MAVEQEPTAPAVDYLEHYGVKGMKWGVIRDHVFNKVGAAETATAAKKIADDNQHRTNRDKVKSKRLVDLSPSKDHVEANFVKKKAKISGVSTLSNSDLHVLINRMNLEVSYKSLKTVQHEQSLVGKGKKWVGNFLTDVLKDAGASWIRRPGSRGSRTSHQNPTKVRSWIGDQPSIPGNYTQKAIGS